ncbi:hypothetical protein CBOM_07780 [Ceraceosorus bombacis]|uniref:Uncharacterized protein n=1 Tax=Ceraceosorus bombacis TaxID=401625 RepID=A0A0P1BPP1_9BASI|nr:hypothetical protein CBOM_07780 [Ceraceosorus bombacis]
MPGTSDPTRYLLELPPCFFSTSPIRVVALLLASAPRAPPAVLTSRLDAVVDDTLLFTFFASCFEAVRHRQLCNLRFCPTFHVRPSLFIGILWQEPPFETLRTSELRPVASQTASSSAR